MASEAVPADPSIDARLQELLDERDIRKVVLRYCRGIDRMDREAVLDCYHPDARDLHGSFDGDPAAYVDWVFGLLDKYSSTMHFIGNQLVELHGERAVCESYGVAFHRGEASRPERTLVTGFRYIDNFERRAPGGPWKIALRVVTTEWVRVDVPEHWWEAPGDYLRGARDRSDPVYDARDRASL